jgi:tetratricopeptide (TPR) repeat protein
MTEHGWPADFEADERQFVCEVGLDALPVVEGCFPAPVLRAAAAGVLPDDVRGVVEGHVAACARCRALRDDLASLDPEGLAPAEEARIRSRLGVALRSPSARRVYWRPALALAASAMLAFVWFARDGWREGPLPPVTAPPRAPAGPARPSVLQPRKPALQLPASVLVRRGLSSETADRLTRALAAWRRDAYQDAAHEFEQVARALPGEPHPHFYFGVAHLLAGDAAGAIAPLIRAKRLASPPLADDATWYLGLALAHTGQVDAAIRELTRLCGHNDSRSVDGCVALQELMTRSP